MPNPIPFERALDVLLAHKSELNVPDPDGYLADLRSHIELKPDDGQADRRAAVLIAVDASKALTTIGVAFFAALGAFALNYRSTHIAAITLMPVSLFVASALFTLGSMWIGFIAIGKAYKRGQRPPDAEGPSWSTLPLSNLLGAQSITGLIALLFFGAAVFLWSPGPATDTTSTQLKNVISLLDDLSKKIERQSSDMGKVNADIASISRRADQLASDTTKVGLEAATATQSAIGTLTAINQRINEVQSAIAEVKAKLAIPAPPSRP